MALNEEKLIEYAFRNVDIGDDCDALEADCKNIIFLFDNCEIIIPKKNRFFINVNCDGIQKMVLYKRAKQYEEELAENGLSVGNETFAYTGTYDFGHTSTEWESVISLGISGLRKRISEYSNKAKSDKKKQRFYNGILKVYDAALRFMKRAWMNYERLEKKDD